MTVQDLQSWADQLELVRLPALEANLALVTSDLAGLDWEFLQKSQELMDSLDAHAIQIEVAQSSADNAELDALDALSRFPSTELKARTYTDTVVQALRDEMASNLAAIYTFLGGTYLGTVQTTSDTAVSSATAEIAAQLAEAAAAVATVNAAKTEMTTATDNLLLTVLPPMQTAIDTASGNIAGLTASQELILTGYAYSTFQEGLDATQASSLNSVNATLASGYYTKAATDSAISASVTTLQANIDSLSGAVTDIIGLNISPTTALATSLSTLSSSINSTQASVTAQGTAIADIESGLSAGYMLRAQAGGNVSLLDLIAADGSGGTPTSIARLSASQILLEGSVTAAHMNVTSLSAISATLGTFKSAPTGARLEIQDDRLTVYRADGSIAVRLGNLL